MDGTVFLFLSSLHCDLPFLPERKIKKFKKLVCNMHNEENYVVHVIALKQALNHRLILKKEHRVIPFHQKIWLKPYIDINTKLKTDAKKDFGKDFFKLMKNAVFGKTMENVRKHRDIKLVTTDNRKNQLASEPNYDTKKYFSNNLKHKIILQSQQRFQSDYHNVYTEQINKIALSSNDDKRFQTFDKITTHPYGINAFKVCESKMLSKIKMINFEDYAKENKTKHNLNWPYILDHPYKILIIGSSGSGKTNA